MCSRCAGVSEASRAVSRRQHLLTIARFFRLVLRGPLRVGLAQQLEDTLLRSAAVAKSVDRVRCASGVDSPATRWSSAASAATSRAPAASAPRVIVPVQRLTCRCVSLTRFACQCPSRISSRSSSERSCDFFSRFARNSSTCAGDSSSQQPARLRRCLRSEVRDESLDLPEQRAGSGATRGCATSRDSSRRNSRSGRAPIRDAIAASAPARCAESELC